MQTRFPSGVLEPETISSSCSNKSSFPSSWGKGEKTLVEEEFDVVELWLSFFFQVGS